MGVDDNLRDILPLAFFFAISTHFKLAAHHVAAKLIYVFHALLSIKTIHFPIPYDFPLYYLTLKGLGVRISRGRDAHAPSGIRIDCWQYLLQYFTFAMFILVSCSNATIITIR